MSKRLSDRALLFLKHEEGPVWASSIADSLGEPSRPVASACTHLVKRGLVRSIPCKGAPNVYQITIKGLAHAEEDPIKARDEGFSDGIIYALQVLTLHGYPAGSTYHDDITNGADREKLVKRDRRPGIMVTEAMGCLREALASQPQAPAAVVPEWFVLVPVKPTPAMVEAICDVHAGDNEWPDDYGASARAIRREKARNGYVHALAAAPAPEVSGG
ncbi:hypothetical protein [Xanthomonas translucens]|uniref:Uncharacterized protein n=2 Tax=Xanthomonas campestris pv. translucens TaxID=343 RepID=A0A120EZ80_XANCT|nr:hypothetical protein [Xanthomonas translucens]KWV17182.1 hypothetical protein ATB53_00445 [Xanthomonas translucens]QSQ34657.1 hypothetical protein ISN31_03260 [Xanthomonas translucens pv. translucens]